MRSTQKLDPLLKFTRQFHSAAKPSSLMRPVKASDRNGEKDGEIGPGLGSHHGPITIKVSHGDNEYEVAVPSDSSFGHLKSVVGEKIGLKPQLLKLLFRGTEKEDNDHLQTAGVKNNSKVKVFLNDEMSSEQESPEEVKETSVVSVGGAAVAEIREEVNKLAEQVSALKAVADSGSKIDEKDILYLTEMLMRQLLKLDGIEAEGEGKVQRKQEVRRVQSLVETMDILKAKNSNTTGENKDTESVSTPETVDPESGSSKIPNPTPPSAPQSEPNSTPQSVPSPAPSHAPVPPSTVSQEPTLDPLVAPLSNPTVVPHSKLYPDPYADLHSNHYTTPQPNHYPYPHPNNYPETHSNHYPHSHSSPYPDTYSKPYNMPHLSPHFVSHSDLYSEPHSSPHHMAYSSHYPYSAHYPTYPEPHLAPHQMPYSAASPPLSYSAPYPMQYSSQSLGPHNPYPYHEPHSIPAHPSSATRHLSYPVQQSDPYQVPSSCTKGTQDWERFD